MAGSRPIKVLLVEDDSEDAKLLTEAVKSVKAADGAIVIESVDDGEKALEYLHKRGAYAAVSRPDLILLDLHLPKRDGIEVLLDIKRDDALRVIPVIALTSSCESDDIWAAYSAGANCYVAKPVGLAAICKLVRLLADLWSVARLPPASP
ncbi:MAG: response regulator [Elusimicrobia bacterium]|nr:response regulator [Elusimicrobiota bacterium]